MQHRSRGCTCTVLKEGTKKKLYLKARCTLHVETRNLSATKYVRSLASVCTMQNADKDERERKRKERGRKAIVELAATEAASPHQQPSPWHLPAPCDWGIVRQEYAAGGVGCALCSGLPGVLISDCFILSGGGGCVFRV